MADTLQTPERPFGAVKETEEQLQSVPIPRRQSTSTSAGQPPAAPQQSNVTNNGRYETDILADSPLATLPMDVQNNLTTAKNWYEIAMHPGATEFERALAMAHYEELEGPKEEEKEDESGTTR